MSKYNVNTKDKTEYRKLCRRYTFLCLLALFLLFVEYKKIFSINYCCFFIFYGLIVFKSYKLKEKIIINTDNMIEHTGNEHFINFFVRLLFSIVTYGIVYFLLKIVSDKIGNEVFKLIFNISESLLMIIFMVRFFHFTIKYLLASNYIVVFLGVLLIYITGWIESKSWQFIALIIVVVNMLLNYEDAQLIYLDIKKNFFKDINFYKDEQAHKMKFLYLKLKFNIAVIFLYVYIILTKDIKIIGKLLPDEFEVGIFYAFMKVFYKGTDRVFCLLLIAILIVLILNKEFFRKKYDSALNKIRKYYIKAFDEITGESRKNCFEESQVESDKKV